MFIQTEQTPNPATLKFLPGEPVMDGGTADFPTAETASHSPLAERLFSVEGVAGVFLGDDFITVTKAEDKEWQVLKPSILGAIMEHYALGEPAVLADEGAATDESAATKGGGGRGRCGAPDQGAHRNPRTSGGRPGRWRHRLSQL